MTELAAEIKQFMDSVRSPPKNAVTSTQSPGKHRKHNHYPMGRMGYNPKLARLLNRDKPKSGRK